MKALGWLIALCGLWEFGDIAALFVPGFGEIQPFLWNHIVVGLVFVIAGVWAALTRSARTAKKLYVAAAVAGLWLMVAAFLLRMPDFGAGLWNDVIVGLIVLVLGGWAAFATPRRAD